MPTDPGDATRRGDQQLEAGQAVWFAFERANQDSFDYRATYVRPL